MRRLIPLLALLSGVGFAQAPSSNQFLLRIEPTRAGFTLQNMTPEEGKLAAQHGQYLRSLLDSGKLRLAAQVLDPNGLWGVIIVNAPDRETARALLDADPGVKGKMFRGEALPLRVVFDKPVELAPAVSVDVKTLESYAGTYRSDQIPLAINASVRDGSLIFQATGQSELRLRPTSATRFEFAEAGIVVTFDSASTFTLEQRGMKSLFRKAQ